MTTRKSDSAKHGSTKKKDREASTAISILKPETVPVPLLGPLSKTLKPGRDAAEHIYRLANKYALIEARHVSQSEDEALELFPVILARFMSEVPVASLAAACAQAKDPNIFLMNLSHQIAVWRYLKLASTT